MEISMSKVDLQKNTDGYLYLIDWVKIVQMV